MIDIVISFDTTGSMFPCLAEVRRKVSDFITTLFNDIPDLQIGIIAHGDYCDVTTYITEQYPLSSDKRELIRFVETVGRTNGGDADECYELVLNQVRGFNWRSGATKAFVMIADADPHPVGYYIGYIINNLDWRNEAQQLVNDGVLIYPVQALNHCRTGFYDALARISNTPHLRLSQFSNVTQLLTGIAYKQKSDEALKKYGDQLQEEGQLDRGLAHAFNLLLNAKDLIGGIEFSEKEGDLERVPPWRFQMLHVDTDTPIKDFVESTGAVFHTGKGFYQLTKPELVQEHKEVVLRNDKGDMFSGSKARDMIGLPYGMRAKIRPMHDLGYTVFIQSTSNNRRLIGGTKFLYEVV